MRAKSDCMASYALCFLVIQVRLSNSRTSWRLNADKVIRTTSQDFAPSGVEDEDDDIFYILTGSLNTGNGHSWSRSATRVTTPESFQIYCNECKSNISPGNQERWV